MQRVPKWAIRFLVLSFVPMLLYALVSVADRYEKRALWPF
jgi:hypothetical protein